MEHVSLGYIAFSIIDVKKEFFLYYVLVGNNVEFVFDLWRGMFGLMLLLVTM